MDSGLVWECRDSKLMTHLTTPSSSACSSSTISFKFVPFFFLGSGNRRAIWPHEASPRTTSGKPLLKMHLLVCPGIGYLNEEMSVHLLLATPIAFPGEMFPYHPIVKRNGTKLCENVPFRANIHSPFH